MESKVRIIIGFLLVSLAAYQVECASLTHHFRSVRDVDVPPSLNTSVTDPIATTKNDTLTTLPVAVTQSSPTTPGDKLNLQTTTDKISIDTAVDKSVNNIQSKKTEDLVPNESKSSEEILPAPTENPVVSRGTTKYQSENKQKNNENETKESSKEETVVKTEEPKATGRSLNINIDKYISPEFHNKNNVYSLPTSPEIEKYLGSDSQDFSEDVTKPSFTRKPVTSRTSLRTTRNEFSFDLTTPQSNIFDTKFQMLVDGIKQNIDELNANTEQLKHDDDEKSNVDNETTPTYDVSKLIDNYKNADNETEVSLETREYKTIDFRTDENKGNKDVESGKTLNYESTQLKSQTYGETPENTDVPVINKIPDNQEEDEFIDNEKHEAKVIETIQKLSSSTESQQTVTTTLKPTSTTFVPSKKPRFQISLRNNTIETTAPDSELKPKTIKHFSYESSSLDPLYETEKTAYTKPASENAINISKRGSTKYVGTNVQLNISTTPSFLDYDSKNSTIPLTTTAGTASENAINISKRGSTKFVGANVELNRSTTPSFMDYDNKNFTIPPTATAWTLVSLKDVPSSSTPVVESNKSDEQNSQENNLIKVRVTPPTRKETTTNSPTSTENDLTSTIKFEKIASSSRKSESSTSYEDLYDEFSTSTEDSYTGYEDFTEQPSKTTDWFKEFERTTTEYNDYTTTDFFRQNYETTSERVEETTENTTFNFKSSKSDVTSTENINSTTEEITTESDVTTTPSVFRETNEVSTVEPEQKTDTESPESTTEFNYETTETMRLSTESMSTTNNMKLIPSKTESENELYTTLKTTSENVSENIDDVTNTSNPNINNISEIESTTPHKITASVTTTKSQKITSTLAANVEPHEEEIDNNSGEVDNDYSDIMKKEKNATDVNDPDIEIVPIDNTEQGSRTTWSPKNIDVSTKKQNETTTVSILKDQKSDVGNIEGENTTVDTTSSTDMLSNDESPDESNSGMIAAIAISSVGGICLILLAGLLLIMRKRQKRVTYGQRCRPVSLDAYSLDNVSVYNSVRRKGALRASKRSYGNPAFDDPVSISHQMNFQSLVKFAENTEDISAEFDEIPQVTARANEVPAGCETKNRYANVIPLPETRVFLKPSDNDPHSDYINANYVTGPKNTRGYYIACQAPMQNTVDDFWRMIWEQQSRVILMLTNLYENGIEKCADYLPPSEVLDCHRLFGDFQITLKKREVKEKYIISSLQLKNMVSNSWREVTHLWYLGWPERGVPTEANSLIAFLIEARSHLKTASNNNSTDDKTNESSNMYISSATGSSSGGPEGGPMVVHCSPGTGRTGTAIACDVAIRDFELTRAVDVPKIVYRVRRDRASAVQTRDQYAFIYKVISLYATKLTGGALDSI